MGVKIVRQGTRQGAVRQISQRPTTPPVQPTAQADQPRAPQGLVQKAVRRERVLRRHRVTLPSPAIAPTSTLFSILIPTVPGRERKLGALLANLDAQVAARRDVELLVLRDNRIMTIGEKRNKLMGLARGDYVAYVDDDDDVSSHYVSKICERLRAQWPDVLCFTVNVRGYGPEKPCRFHPDYVHAELPAEYRRQPNHLMVWRRDLVASIPFPTISHGEDTAWATAIVNKAHKVATLDQVLYTYKFDPNDNSSLR